MKTGNHQPRLLSAVMEAIANLRDGRGSTQKKIIDQVQTHLNSQNVPFRNAQTHIRKAIKHGVDSGLIKENGGKFKLGLRSKDYAIFKSFQKFNNNMPVREVRRRRRRRRSKRGRRRRRRSDRSPDDHNSLSGSGSDTRSGLGTPEPADRGRRRRRRGRRGRRRRGRRRAEERDSVSSSRGSSKDVTPKSSEGNSKQAKPRDQDDEELKYEDLSKDDPTCGYPECLCNIKPNINEGGYRNSHEDFMDS